MTEREQFEAWAKARYAKNPHFWLRQIDDGGYSCGMADSAWDAWQAARAQPAQAVPPGYVLVPVEPTPEIVAVMAVQEASGSINGTKTIGMAGAVAAYDAMIAAAAAQGEKP